MTCKWAGRGESNAGQLHSSPGSASFNVDIHPPSFCQDSDSAFSHANIKSRPNSSPHPSLSDGTADTCQIFSPHAKCNKRRGKRDMFMPYQAVMPCYDSMTLPCIETEGYCRQIISCHLARVVTYPYTTDMCCQK